MEGDMVEYGVICVGHPFTKSAGGAEKCDFVDICRRFVIVSFLLANRGLLFTTRVAIVACIPCTLPVPAITFTLVMST